LVLGLFASFFFLSVAPGPVRARFYRPCDKQIEEFVAKGFSAEDLIGLAKRCQEIGGTITGRNDEQYWVLSAYANLKLGNYEQAGNDAMAAHLYAYGNALRDNKTANGDFQGMPAMLMAVSRLLWALNEGKGVERLDHQLEQAYLFAYRGLWAAGCGMVDGDQGLPGKIYRSDLTLDAESRDRVCQESMLVMAASDMKRGNLYRACRRLEQYKTLLQGARRENTLSKVDYSSMASACEKVPLHVKRSLAV
jgi:hypothetical protein